MQGEETREDHASSASGENACPSSGSCHVADADAEVVDDRFCIELNSLFAMLDENPDSSRKSEDDFLDNRIESSFQASPPEDGVYAAPFLDFEPTEETGSSGERAFGYTGVPGTEMTNSLTTVSPSFTLFDDLLDGHPTDSLNVDDSSPSASYPSDGSVSASLLNVEFEDDRDGEWTWNPNSSPVSMGFPGSRSSPCLPSQVPQPMMSCQDKHIIDLNGNPPDEPFSGSMLKSYSESSRTIERPSYQNLRVQDSLPTSFSSLPQRSLQGSSFPFIQNKKQRVYSDSATKDESMPTFWPFRRRVDKDPDVCIIDDVTGSQPSTAWSMPRFGQPRHGVSSAYQPRVTSSGTQSTDDKLAFKIALQDLAQPKLETSPPQGVLAVSLLRHQRIALSWMVQKETLNTYCSGGILADDQGLGKTVSTIALILMERSPASKTSPSPTKGEIEALTIDEDGEFQKSTGLKRKNGTTLLSESTPHNMFQQGRPAAGTLVVCPTSVLRQWADELKNKVKANLSFLVYHGSNRTRDPDELAKYDVVLTTYSIVSMEVPGAKLNADEENNKNGEEEKKKKSSSKSKRKTENSLLQCLARPLGKVNWFRVILDEAQTIKNHRTQVARACWGLRAKRRWCLSGTPIQNAIDDLYSYFRFLRYEPFATYTSFCSRIKLPINRNPNEGYRKLQAILKTVMLRRTKGTLLDGKPIINLPPKTIKLKKVDFSKEERDFYSKLEAESREKFQGYADAGTVKQNYVNILLMLLRLRQACDHPLLVRGYDSSSSWKSSLETAKKIPREKQIQLLNALENSLCTLCNDPPEDSVVTICGHVFCNQCISESLNGDEDNCPFTQCKTKLTSASVFSKSTLKTCISGQLESTEVADPLVVNVPCESSKIKATIEMLQSLPTYYDSSEPSSNGNDDVKPDLQNSKPIERKEKAIIFSQWTRMLDLLESKLKSSFIHYRRLDGTMSVASRDKAVKDFNTLPEVTVMIMSLKAASLGLNMVAACNVLLLDLWWNPTTEDQAIDRAHRIGQTRPVTVSRLTVENTVEDRILALQEKKREMVASAFGEDGSGSHQSRLTLEDLRYLFRA